MPHVHWPLLKNLVKGDKAVKDHGCRKELDRNKWMKTKNQYKNRKYLFLSLVFLHSKICKPLSLSDNKAANKA